MDSQALNTAIQFAKQNPDDPRSSELQRRIQTGAYNPQLKQLNIDTSRFVTPEEKAAKDTQDTQNNNFIGSLMGKSTPTPQSQAMLQAQGGGLAAGVKSFAQHPVDTTKAFLGGAAEGTGATLPLNVMDMAGHKAISMLPDNFQVAGVTKQQMLDNLAKSTPLSDQFKTTMGGDQHPDAYTAGQITGTVASLAPAAIEHVPQAAAYLADKAAPLVNAGVQGAKDLAQPVISKVEARSAAKVASTALDNEKAFITDATPSYNKNMVSEPQVNIKNPDGTITTIPRVIEHPGMNPITVRPVTSTQKEIDAGKELQTIPNYPSKGTNLEKLNVVNPEIVKQAEELKVALTQENIPRPAKEVSKLVTDAVNNASEGSLAISKTDPVVKNYLRVANRAINANKGDLAGELEVRQALDKAYEDAGGKWVNNKGLDQIHRASRDALNADIEFQAKGTKYAESLKRQSNLYNAKDVLEDKAMAEGASKLDQAMKAHPVVSNIVKAGAKATGLGAGIHLIP